MPVLVSSTGEQAHALATQAGFWLRQDLRVLRVEGDDRLSWLNGQLTNDLRALEQQAAVHALAVQVRGKILAEVWVVAQAEALLVVLPQAAEAMLRESFERYIIMEDVTLVAWPEARVLSLLGPAAAQLAAAVSAAGGFACDELGQGGHAWLGTEGELSPIAAVLRARGAVEIDERGYELARLRMARPRFGLDYGERSYPQEAGLKQLVSFAKGCYLGQEVVCTLENRGRLTRQLALWRGPRASDARAEEPPAAGTPLKAAGDETLGEITSAVWDPEAGAILALGYVKRAHAAPGTTLTAAGTHFTLQQLVGADGA